MSGGALIIGRGEEQDPAALKLYTFRNRNFVPNEIPDFEQSPDALRAGWRYAKSVTEDLHCRALSAMYNCAGMVFAARRTAIDAKHIPMILADDEHRRLAEAEEPRIGDIVLYRNEKDEPTHVGIFVEARKIAKEHEPRTERWVLSQWGYIGEFSHRIDEIPLEYGKKFEFWTNRRVTP